MQSIWHELGIDGVIGESQAKHGEGRQPFERALFAMVANRTSDPCSKLYCRQQWLPEEVFLPGKEKLELQHLYRAMDFLEAHKARVEREVFFHMADLTEDLASDIESKVALVPTAQVNRPPHSKTRVHATHPWAYGLCLSLLRG